MKRIYIKAFNELKKVGCPVFQRSDYPDTFLISAEDESSEDWADYYSHRWSGHNTNPALDKILSSCGLFAEWETPGCLIVFKM